jgi:hypothetical protein
MLVVGSLFRGRTEVLQSLSPKTIQTVEFCLYDCKIASINVSVCQQKIS